MDSYLGQIRLFAGPFAPAGWRICDGALLSVQNYEPLFSLLGTTWGGDGTTNFSLPDLRGRVVVGQGQGAGLSARTLAQTGGRSTVPLTEENHPKHTHQIFATNQSADTATVASGVGLAKTDGPPSPGTLARYADSTQTGSNAPVPVAMDILSIGPAGSPTPAQHENLMPYCTLNYIICTDGTYPPRS